VSPLATILAVLLASAGDDPAPGSSDILALELEPVDAPLWARAGLAARYTVQGALPSTQLLFDQAAQVFATGLYLTPGASQGYASGLVFVSAGWEAACQELEGLLPGLNAYQGRLASNAQTLVEFLKLYEAAGILTGKIFTYASNA